MYSMFLGQPHQSIIDWINGHQYNPPTPPAPAYHEETWYKYVDDTEWRTTNLKGQIFRFEGGTSSTDGDGYIENDASIAAIEIGTDVTSIQDFTFDGCSNLTSVTLPNVMSIGQGAFNGCTGLTTVTIPANVTSIGQQAFMNCPLENINLLMNTKPSCGEQIFGTTAVRQIKAQNMNISQMQSLLTDTYNITGYNDWNNVTVICSDGTFYASCTYSFDDWTLIWSFN